MSKFHCWDGRLRDPLLVWLKVTSKSRDLGQNTSVVLPFNLAYQTDEVATHTHNLAYLRRLLLLLEPSVLFRRSSWLLLQLLPTASSGSCRCRSILMLTGSWSFRSIPTTPESNSLMMSSTTVCLSVVLQLLLLTSSEAVVELGEMICDDNIEELSINEGEAGIERLSVVLHPKNNK